jgi:hypothetical protein
MCDKDSTTSWNWIQKLYEENKWKFPDEIVTLDRNNAVCNVGQYKEASMMRQLCNKNDPNNMREELSGSKPNTQFVQRQYHLGCLGTIQVFENKSITRLGRHTQSDVLYTIREFCAWQKIPSPGLIYVSNSPMNGRFLNESYRYLLIKKRGANDLPNFDHVSFKYDGENKITSMLFVGKSKAFTAINVKGPAELNDVLMIQAKHNRDIKIEHTKNIRVSAHVFTILRKLYPATTDTYECDQTVTSVHDKMILGNTTGETVHTGLEKKGIRVRGKAVCGKTTRTLYSK